MERIAQWTFPVYGYCMSSDYSFDEYLSWRAQTDFWRDDEFLQATIKRYSHEQWETVDTSLREVSPRLSQDWTALLQVAARPENAIRLEPYDPYNNRVDRLVRSAQMEQLEREMFGEALFADDTSDWVSLVKMGLFLAHGEAGVNCPLACTAGLVTLLEQFADRPETLAMLEHLKHGVAGHYGRGAQYLTEIQGGSDVAANQLRAVRDDDGEWRLYGDKFFCSATQADYSVVTARVTEEDAEDTDDAPGVGLFVVPSWLPGNAPDGPRNGFTINRLKHKLGSREMPTAELTFDGALAYQLGRTDRGIANMTRHVLAQSRLNCGLATATGVSRAYREAKQYTQYREAFGVPVAQFPLVQLQLAQLERASKRYTAGMFRITGDFIRLRSADSYDVSEDRWREQFRLRQLIMLSKLVTAEAAPNLYLQAMTLLGANGMMEDFCDLPRLFRDSVTNQMWEGPRNILLTQIFNDLSRHLDRYPPKELVAELLPTTPADRVSELGSELEAILAHGTLSLPGAGTLDICERWIGLSETIFHEYCDAAVADVESHSELPGGQDRSGAPAAQLPA